MKDKEWMNCHFQEDPTAYDPGIKHVTVNYCDDSNNIIRFKEPDEANHYCNKFFITLKAYYNMNRLVLNGDKTGLLLVNRPALNHYKHEIYLVEQP